MPGRSICRLGRLSYVKLAFGKHACLRISFDLECGCPSYVDETPSPETEKPPAMEFRDRCRVEEQVGQILFAFDSMNFDKEHIESRDCLSGYQVSSGRYSKLRTPIGFRGEQLNATASQESLSLFFETTLRSAARVARFLV